VSLCTSVVTEENDVMVNSGGINWHHRIYNTLGEVACKPMSL